MNDSSLLYTIYRIEKRAEFLGKNDDALIQSGINCLKEKKKSPARRT